MPPASDDQVRVLLKKLVGEVNLLQKRLDSFEGRGGTLECDLAASSNNNLEEPKRSSGNEGRISNSPAKSRGSPLESVKKLQQVKPADKSPVRNDDPFQNRHFAWFMSAAILPAVACATDSIRQNCTADRHLECVCARGERACSCLFASFFSSQP